MFGCLYWRNKLLITLEPDLQISYDLLYDYRNFIVRLTYDSDLKRAEIFVRKLICEHNLRRYYDFARESYNEKLYIH